MINAKLQTKNCEKNVRNSEYLCSIIRTGKSSSHFWSNFTSSHRHSPRWIRYFFIHCFKIEIQNYEINFFSLLLLLLIFSSLSWFEFKGEQGREGSGEEGENGSRWSAGGRIKGFKHFEFGTKTSIFRTE